MNRIADLEHAMHGVINLWPALIMFVCIVAALGALALFIGGMGKRS